MIRNITIEIEAISVGIRMNSSYIEQVYLIINIYFKHTILRGIQLNLSGILIHVHVCVTINIIFIHKYTFN